MYEEQSNCSTLIEMCEMQISRLHCCDMNLTKLQISLGLNFIINNTCACLYLYTYTHLMCSATSDFTIYSSFFALPNLQIYMLCESSSQATQFKIMIIFERDASREKQGLIQITLERAWCNDTVAKLSPYMCHNLICALICAQLLPFPIQLLTCSLRKQ